MALAADGIGANGRIAHRCSGRRSGPQESGVPRLSYQAVYYRDPQGHEPVNDTIRSLVAKCQDSVDDKISLLNMCDDKRPHLPFPHTSALRGTGYGELRELRCDCGKQHHRIIYGRSDRFLILLHMIPGKTGKIPEQDKRIALRRWGDFKARMDAEPTAKPRAMGADAPSG